MAIAWQSEVLFQNGNWKVQILGTDGGTPTCAASVANGTDSFTIHADADQSINVLFQSTAWDIGAGTADLQVEIDRRGPWNLTDADQHAQRVAFYLPDRDSAVRFVVEVAQGSRLHLRDGTGREVTVFALSGARAAINALIACGDQIRSGNDPLQK